MRTLVALAAVLIVIPAASSQAHADRATAIAQDLQLPPDATARIASTLASYDAELSRLQLERAALRRELLVPHTDSMSQKLLDDVIANERALYQLDEGLIAHLRPQLAPDQIMHMLVLLSATEPEPPRAIAPVQPATAPQPKPRGCDPFKQMHRCPER